MRRLPATLGCLCVCLTGAFWPTVAKAQGKKLALLIGVQYSENALKLHTKPDVDAIERTLELPLYGFQKEDIVRLDTPETTTKKAIEDAFQSLAARVKVGDIVFIHYSGHGSQVPAAHPETEPDGRDETIVGSDHTETHDAEISDDQIDEWIHAIDSPAHKPLSLTIVMDCCHSGTGTRDGVGLPRKLSKKYAKSLPVSTVSFKAGEYLGQQGNAAALDNVVVIGACRSDEVAKESITPTGPMGALSRALVECMTTGGFGPQAPCRDIIADVASRLRTYNPNQTPQLEGNGLQKFLGGAFQHAAAFVPVDKGSDPVHRTLKAGFLTNVQVGSVYALYKSGKPEPDPVDLVCAMKVTSVQPFESTLELVDDSTLTRTKLSEATSVHAVLTEIPPALQPLSVAVDERLASMPEWAKAVDQIKATQTSRSSGRIDTFFSVNSKAYYSNESTSNEAKQCDVRIEFDPMTKSIVFKEPNGGSSTRSGPSSGIIEAWNHQTASNAPGLAVDSDDLGLSVQATLNKVSKLRFLKNGLRNTTTYSKVTMQVRLMKAPYKVEHDSSNNEYDVVDTGTGKFDPKATPATFKKCEFDPTNASLPLLKDNERIVIQVKNTGYVPALAHILDVTADGTVGALWPRREDPSTKDFIAPCAAADRDDPDKGWVTLSYQVGTDMVPNPFRITPPYGREMFKLISTTVPLDLDILVDQLNARDVEKGSQGPLAEVIRMSTLGMRADNSAKNVPTSEWWTTEAEFIVGN